MNLVAHCYLVILSISLVEVYNVIVLGPPILFDRWPKSICQDTIIVVAPTWI